jgi:uncharacterized membrane protein
MIFFLVLVVATGAATAVLALRRTFSVRLAASSGMAVAMVFAGVSHLLWPTPFVQHLPTWVPMREDLIFATGLLEIALGVGLMLREPLRRWAGLALAGYLVAVFPSNIYVALAGVDVDGQPGGAYPWLRLPLQLLFIGWAFWSTGRTKVTGRAGPPSGPPHHGVAGDHARILVSLSEHKAPDPTGHRATSVAKSLSDRELQVLRLDVTNRRAPVLARPRERLVETAPSSRSHPVSHIVG